MWKHCVRTPLIIWKKYEIFFVFNFKENLVATWKKIGDMGEILKEYLRDICMNLNQKLRYMRKSLGNSRNVCYMFWRYLRDIKKKIERNYGKLNLRLWEN